MTTICGDFERVVFIHVKLFLMIDPLVGREGFVIVSLFHLGLSSTFSNTFSLEIGGDCCWLFQKVGEVILN